MVNQNSDRQLQPNSQASVILSEQQKKDRYLIAAAQAIDKRTLPIVNRVIEAAFANTVIGTGEAERSIKKLGELNMEDDVDFNFMIDLVGNWRMLLGATKETDPALFRVEAIYLVDTHPDLTIVELKTAIRLLSEHKLNIKLPFVVNFSCMFMSHVIQAYIELKETLIASVINVADKQYLPPPEPSIQERLDDMKYMIVECKKFLEKCEGLFVFHDVYDFLRKTKRLVFTPEMVEEAKKYGERRYGLWVSSQPLQLNRVSSEVKKERETMVREFGIYYCLMEYFKKIDLAEELKKIEESEYIDYINKKKNKPHPTPKITDHDKNSPQ